MVLYKLLIIAMAWDLTDQHGSLGGLNGNDKDGDSRPNGSEFVEGQMNHGTSGDELQYMSDSKDKFAEVVDSVWDLARKSRKRPINDIEQSYNLPLQDGIYLYLISRISRA